MDSRRLAHRPHRTAHPTKTAPQKSRRRHPPARQHLAASPRRVHRNMERPPRTRRSLRPPQAPQNSHLRPPRAALQTSLRNARNAATPPAPSTRPLRTRPRQHQNTNPHPTRTETRRLRHRTRTPTNHRPDPSHATRIRTTRKPLTLVDVGLFSAVPAQLPTGSVVHAIPVPTLIAATPRHPIPIPGSVFHRSLPKLG